MVSQTVYQELNNLTGVNDRYMNLICMLPSFGSWFLMGKYLRSPCTKNEEIMNCLFDAFCMTSSI